MSIRDTNVEKMDYAYELMTAEDVLRVFKAEHHVSKQFCEADPDAEICYEMTVRQWRDALDLIPASELGIAYNKRFQMDVPETEWNKALFPEKKKTLRGVCGLIASCAKKIKLQPVTILGKPCLPAGLFLLIQKKNGENGGDISDLKPSTPIVSFLSGKERHSLIKALIELAPGILEKFRSDYYNDPFRMRTACVGAILLIVSLVLMRFDFYTIGIVGLALSGLLFFIRFLYGKFYFDKSRKFYFDNIMTFKDLCGTILQG
jgi:hypothetical protein